MADETTSPQVHDQHAGPTGPTATHRPGGSGGAPLAGGPPSGPPARRSRVARVALAAAAFVLIAALAATATVWVQTVGRERRARADLDAAARLLEAAEDDLVTVDAAVRADISSEVATQAAAAIGLAARIRADALAASALVDKALPDLEARWVPLAQAIKDSADARAAMMAEAPTILEADVKAASAMASADRAVAEIKAAEGLVAKAVQEFNKHTQAGVKQSTAYSNEAASHLEAARSLLETATAAFPEADFSAFVEYIDAKLGLIAMSKEIDSLWLAGKIEESNRKLEAYNKRDAEVLAMAKALPDSVRDPIADAYEALTGDATDRYFEAREKARAAGERVRELRRAATGGA